MMLRFSTLYNYRIAISNSILYLETCLQLYLDAPTTIRPDFTTAKPVVPTEGGMFMFKIVSKFQYICTFNSRTIY